MRRRLFWLILVGIGLTVIVSFPALAQYNPYRKNLGFANQAYNPYATRLPEVDEVFGRFALDFLAAALGFMVGAFFSPLLRPFRRILFFADMRPLFPPDRLMMQFAAGKMLVLAQGQRPIITDRIAYWDDASLAGTWDDPRRPAPATDGPTRPQPPTSPTKAPPPRQPVAGSPAPANQPPASHAVPRPVALPPPRPAPKVDMEALTAALMQQAEPAKPPVTLPPSPQG